MNRPFIQADRNKNARIVTDVGILEYRHKLPDTGKQKACSESRDSASRRIRGIGGMKSLSRVGRQSIVNEGESTHRS